MSILACAALLLAAPVRHEPMQPTPGVPVVVTARLGAGTTAATLKVQSVAPGKYVRKTDAEYEKDWTDLPMTKGANGAFTATVPAEVQKPRHLIRYRVVGTDAAGKATRLPAADDPCPNFAWWCDAGPAAWKGSREPGKVPAVEFGPEFLRTLQPIHLLARGEDVAKSQWDGNFHKQRQPGTVVYKGVVYDHVQFSNRGQGSAHISGKNKWALKFNKAQPVPFVDHAGVPSPVALTSLDLNPGGSTPYLPVLRGITGLDEVLCMRSYRLAGVPAPSATWVQWRVVTTAAEVDAKDQYKGDLWGVYVAVGEMEPAVLADRPLPDGLTVSTQSGVKYAPKGIADPGKEWEAFIGAARGNPKEEWWRKNLDLPAYYSFHALNRLLGNVDLRPDGNHGYYRNPDGRWAPIPWDMDMTFVPRHHQPGVIEAAKCLNHPAIALEYRNRAREVLDLFAGDATERGGQVGQLVADLGGALAPKGFAVDWPRLDEAVWNRHPRMNQKGSWFVNPMDGDHFGGRWKRTLATNDLAGFRKYLVDFCTDSRPSHKYAPNDGDQRGYGWGYLAHEAADATTPRTPTVERPGGGRKFTASEFSSPVGRASAALEWRVGRVGKPGWYELADHWKAEVKEGTSIEVPAEVFCEAGEYRVRVRWRDASGRCGHWSTGVRVEVR